MKQLRKILLATLLVGVSFAQLGAQDSTFVSGRVLALDGTPLANVSVSIEGSADLPVLTDENGDFMIKTASKYVWLFLDPSARKYKTKRVFLNDRNQLTIYISDVDMKSGSDLVPIMSNLVPRRDVIAAHSELNVDEIAHIPALSVDEYMQLRTPGVHVVNKSAHPGSGTSMTLRGIRSIYANNDPLIIVDGIPLGAQGSVFESNLAGYNYNPLLAVNPFDISRMVVIKDPGITAAYGSKASNGLIYIETLDPSATQTSIDVDLRSGMSIIPEYEIPVMNAKQHRSLISELLFSSKYLEEEVVELYPSLFLEKDEEGYINYLHNTNWQEYIFDNAMFTSLNVKVKGGDGIARYGLSFGYNDAKGIIRNSGYQGYNLRFTSMLNIFTWLKMDAGVSLNNSNSDLKEAATVSQTNPILTSLSKSPMLNPYQYDTEGNELSILANVDEIGVSNPLATIENFNAQNTNINFSARLGLTATINRNMHVKSNFRFNYNILKEKIYMPNQGMELYYNDEAHNVAKLSNNSLNGFYNNTYLNYTKQLGTDHKIISNTGVHLDINNFQYDWGLTKNAHENDQYQMIQDGQNALREIGGMSRSWNWLSFYEYARYSYRDRYFATASVSLDGSSRVGDNAANTIQFSGTPFGLFYAGGLAWRVSNESFLKNQNWLENLKVRASYGISGNDDIGEASATNYYQSVKIRETVGLYPASVPNPALTYETVSQLNVGMDLAILGNRISASFDYYISTTEDMINFSPIESYLGYDMRIENNGVMSNTGWETNLFIRLIDAGDFKWDISANLSAIKNEVTEIEGDKMVYEIPGGERVNMVGETAHSFYGYNYLGVYATQQEAIDAALRNDKNVPYQAGDAIYEDMNGDSVINDLDKIALGSSLPEMFGGLLNTFTYKRFSLSAALQVVSGNEVFNYIRFYNERMTDLSNQSTAVLGRWQYEGQETMVPRALYGDPVGNSAFSSRWIEDGSYIRLKQITLSYTIPEEMFFFKNLQVYVTANNLFTLSNYLGYDPEFAFSNSQMYQGIDYGLTPQSRQFLVGLRLGL